MKLVYLSALTFVLTLSLSCKHKRNSAYSDSGGGDTRKMKVEFLDDDTYKLSVKSTDKTYAFTEGNPVKCGSFSDGPKNERRFLNALLGPNGETVRYYRVGSCCHFKTPNGLMNNTGLLDKYKVYWKNIPDTLIIFMNMYDKGDLLIPVGFNAKIQDARH